MISSTMLPVALLSAIPPPTNIATMISPTIAPTTGNQSNVRSDRTTYQLSFVSIQPRRTRFTAFSPLCLRSAEARATGRTADLHAHSARI
jgi:hypothetical protein